MFTIVTATELATDSQKLLARVIEGGEGRWLPRGGTNCHFQLQRARSLGQPALVSATVAVSAGR